MLEMHGTGSVKTREMIGKALQDVRITLPVDGSQDDDFSIGDGGISPKSNIELESSYWSIQYQSMEMIWMHWCIVYW